MRSTFGLQAEADAEEEPLVNDRWWRLFRRAGAATFFHVDLAPQAKRERAAFFIAAASKSN